MTQLRLHFNSFITCRITLIKLNNPWHADDSMKPQNFIGHGELWAVQCMCDRVSTSNLTQISNVTYRQIVTIHCHILQMHLHSLVLDREHVSVIPALHVPLSTLHDPSTSGADGCGSLLPSYPCSWCCQYRQ